MLTNSLSISEAYQFSEDSKLALKQYADKSLSEKGVQGLIDFCVLFKISDKHLEMLFGWERGTVMNYKKNNTNLNWSDFVWVQF